MSRRQGTICCLICRHDWQFVADEPRIEGCPACGLPTTVPPPERDVFTDELFTEGAYGGQRLARREQWLREARRRLDWVQQHTTGRRLLEVGSATGEFVAVAERAGLDVTGIEASEWAAGVAQDLTDRVLRVDHAVWLAESTAEFDTVVLFHTLEHVHDPQGFLAPLVRALAPDGRLFLEVPNGSARDAKDGAAWCGSRFADHVVHYRAEDLRRLAEQVGLVVEHTSTLTMSEFDPRPIWWLRRLRWLAKGRVAPSQDFLRAVLRRA